MSDIRDRIARRLLAEGLVFDDHAFRAADAVLAVLRELNDEDVERAAKASFEDDGTGDWGTAGEQVQGEWRSDTDAAIRAYLGGGEA